MSFPSGRLKATFRSVLGPHSDHERPALRQMLADALWNAHWKGDVSRETLEQRRLSSTELCYKLRKSLLVQTVQPTANETHASLRQPEVIDA